MISSKLYDLAVLRPCGTCGAGVGLTCIRASGTPYPMKYVHTLRQDQAIEDHIGEQTTYHQHEEHEEHEEHSAGVFSAEEKAALRFAVELAAKCQREAADGFASNLTSNSADRLAGMLAARQATVLENLQRKLEQ